MSGRSVGLLARQKRRADLDALGTERERRGDSPPVGDSTSGDRGCRPHRTLVAEANMPVSDVPAIEETTAVTTRFKAGRHHKIDARSSTAIASSTVVAAPMVTIR